MGSITLGSRICSASLLGRGAHDSSALWGSVRVIMTQQESYCPRRRGGPEAPPEERGPRSSSSALAGPHLQDGPWSTHRAHGPDGETEAQRRRLPCGPCSEPLLPEGGSSACSFSHPSRSLCFRWGLEWLQSGRPRVPLSTPVWKEKWVLGFQKTPDQVQ